ncbi:L-serine ammonia-lyase, iron-sulfur-dependent subunit beta [Alkalibacillus haloalkaliphilus]|uniref:L-serine deaminase n=1 Tax=Alkalibacillus haloalkaliphilus TaxID=94136 RepID=A0A511W1H0_9BACI|nr:L-serine ammonia-lyase, iron-sulfur-dependent subunit beta [Alkalibacillus haloalkaliphilus]MDV2580560.1 L-serine ammonia-lyase, iron-sulfur-dependent subunit beta [Alkalibacillus haloalkaliphilus]GEN44877.1 putative L-serine dehydratase, beta chain [Alkalibacillus haloalkaliphilus]
MKFRSVFDIIGPVMIGPSSSHTAGAARIGKMARELFGRQPDWAKIHLYGSFAKTYQGHGTDVALVGGILGFSTYDERIKDALNLAKEANLDIEFIEEDGSSDHPNTARIQMGDEDGDFELVGISIGGGKAEITELNGFELRLTGQSPAILVMHNDRFGAIAAVTNVLAEHEINIGHMEVARKEEGKDAMMIIETDERIPDHIMDELNKCDHIMQVVTISE